MSCAEENCGVRSASSKQVYNNPFIIKERFLAQRITQVYLSSKNAGYCHAPNKITLSFAVEDKTQKPITTLSKRDIKLFLISKDTKIPLKYRRHLSSGKYWCSLAMPVVKQKGYYDLLISLQIGGGKTLSKRMSKCVYYKTRKVNLLFLVDNSGSMVNSDPNNRRLIALLDIIDNPDFQKILDKIAIITFSDQAEVLLPFTSVFKTKENKNSAPIDSSGKKNRPSCGV